MPFTVQKSISPVKPSPFKGLVNALILLIAVPVIVIAVMSLGLYFFVVWLKNKIFPNNPMVSAEENYHLEIDLVNNEQVHILLIEDEFDMELTRLNEAWQENVYNEETCLYRARTVPFIPALEGSIVSFYYKEVPGGLLLQVLPAGKYPGNVLHSQLVYLRYNNLTIMLVDELGAYYLHNDSTNNQLIHGINKENKLLLEISETENTFFREDPAGDS